MSKGNIESYRHLSKIQLAMTLLVTIGGYVLGNSINNPSIVVASFVGPAVAFFVVDRLNWIEISGWKANVLLVLILVYSMQDFVGGDSATKLTSVAVLLSYLLIALCFQKKTPRLCWQILVLSILQMLEAAIFNLNFEYGIFFVFYFFVATSSLILQSDYSDWNKIRRSNQKNLQLSTSLSLSHTLPASLSPLVAVARNHHGQNLFDRFGMLLPWLVGSLFFSFILFHSLPHTRQDWADQFSSEFTVTGQSKSGELINAGVIGQTNKLLFRARFMDLDSEDLIPVVGKPYFRGMALSKLEITNGRSGWRAPYEHVFNNRSYSALPRYNNRRSKNVRAVNLEVVIEPVADPLVYTTTPFFRKANGDSEIELCRDLSALTRRKSRMGSTIASYKYELTTFLDSVNRPLRGYPYRSTDLAGNFPSMEDGSPEHQLLTEFDPQSFPQLRQIAEAIAMRLDDPTSAELCQALLRHFSSSNGYQYTIDYRNVDVDERLDPVEDFVANHRSGHCTMYASALTLMLRSLGIPARYVVGFYGGQYNNLTDCYVVRGRHAHAWVEAYIAPEDCSPAMIEDGIARRECGAWLTLDPTPPTFDEGASSEALDLARTIWQDYVISPDHNKQSYSNANSLFMAGNRGSRFTEFVEDFFESMTANRLTQASLVLLTIALVLYPVVQKRRREKQSSATNQKMFQGVFARALSAVSPKLARWLAGSRPDEIAFYQKFESIVCKYTGLNRSPDQTQWEFSDAVRECVADQMPDCMQTAPINEILQRVTEAFYQARFSPIPLDKTAVDDIENQIQTLDKLLKTGKV